MKKILYIIKQMIVLHKFFLVESPKYLGGMDRHDYALFPHAYIEFMWACFKDIIGLVHFNTVIHARTGHKFYNM